MKRDEIIATVGTIILAIVVLGSFLWIIFGADWSDLTDTKWWHQYITSNPTANVRFLRGRLKFGGAKNSAPFPSAIVIFFNTTLDEWGGVN